MAAPSLSQDEFRVLNYLDIYKFVYDVDFIKVGTCLDEGAVHKILESLKERGFVEEMEGTGIQITSKGEKAAEEYREAVLERIGGREVLGEIYDKEFSKLNNKIKEVVTKWQMKIVSGNPVPNDHKDPEYDRAVIEELLKAHEKVRVLFAKLTEALPWYDQYLKRLERAVSEIKAGNHSYVADDTHSYHNVWYELHEDLLKLLKREREE